MSIQIRSISEYYLGVRWLRIHSSRLSCRTHNNFSTKDCTNNTEYERLNRTTSISFECCLHEFRWRKERDPMSLQYHPNWLFCGERGLLSIKVWGMPTFPYHLRLSLVDVDNGCAPILFPARSPKCWGYSSSTANDLRKHTSSMLNTGVAQNRN